jgi:hypothetical protein
VFGLATTTVLIPNGVDSEVWRTPALNLRERWGVGSSRWLLSVTNHTPAKNHGAIFDVVHEIQKAFRIDVMPLDQSVQCRAVIAVVVLLGVQPAEPVGRDLEQPAGDLRRLLVPEDVREHMARKNHARGIDLLRSVKKTNFEFQEMLESLLTQETSFFRYPGVFEAFEKRILPELHIRKFWKNPRSLRIWSAGCSTGEEPYSIAITVADALNFSDAWNVEILATDIGRQALAIAERGVYSGRSIASVNDCNICLNWRSARGARSSGRLCRVRPDG